MNFPPNSNKGANPIYQLNFIQLLQSFTFYGIRSLLILYFTKNLLFSDSQALTLYGNTMAFLYVAPLVGGLLIDKVWSGVLSLRIGVGITCFGTLLLSLPYDHTFLYGLAVLIVGQGLFKPTIPYLMDQLYETDQKRESGYTFYYVMLNVGTMSAPFLCGILKQTYGWQASFSACFLSSLLGLFFAFRYSGITASLNINRQKLMIFCGGGLASSLLILYFLSFPHWVDHLMLYLTPVVGVYLGYLYVSSENKQGTLLMFLAVFLFFLFVVLFEQAGGSVALFIEKYVNRTIGSFENIPSPLFQGLNPFFTIIIGLCLTRLLRVDGNNSPLKQLALGFFCIAGGFILLWVSASLATEWGKANAWWVIGTFLFHSVGELCIVPITLSLATQFAPQKRKGSIIGLWYLAAAYGHYFAVWLSTSVLLKGVSDTSATTAVSNFAEVFALTTAIALGGAVVLWGLSFLYKEKPSSS
jgi:proton-dependent oligopeptide transporter, POT family